MLEDGPNDWMPGRDVNISEEAARQGQCSRPGDGSGRPVRAW